MCKILIQGRGWHRLTLMSAPSCLSLVPQLNYQQGHTSDFSIKMFYVEPGEFERHWKCFGRSLPFLSHSSLPVWKTRQFWVFCPWHMVKGCRGNLVPKEEKISMVVVGQLSPTSHLWGQMLTEKGKHRADTSLPHSPACPNSLLTQGSQPATLAAFNTDFCPSNCEHLMSKM